MKIRDDRAGTKGRCPKCHAEFTVPQPTPGDEDEHAVAAKAAAVKADAAGEKGDEEDDYLRMMMSDDGGSSAAAPAVAKKSSRKSEGGQRRSERHDEGASDGAPTGNEEDDDVLRLTPSADGDDDVPPPQAGNPFEDDEPRQVKKHVKKESLAAAASVASDLLKHRKSDPDEIEKRKSSAAFGYDIDPNKREKIEIDVAESMKVFSKSFLLPLLGVVAACGLLYWASASMMKSRKLPPLGLVSGVVTLDGAPVSDAELTFIPSSSVTGGAQVSSSYGRTDSQGHYTLIYLEDVPGAVVGEHHVQIRAADMTGRERLPKEYNARTTLKCEVKPGRNDDVDFQLKSAESKPAESKPAEPKAAR
jgi:hypothetical protein